MRLLEIGYQDNTWEPPEIDENILFQMAVDVREDKNAIQSKEYLYIFRTNPYIDSVYIVYDEGRQPVSLRRFTFHEGYIWSRSDELYFHEHCIKEMRCAFSGAALDDIFNTYNTNYPDWHLNRYYSKGVRILDHIYNCMKNNTVKELLYKAGLDDLAAYSDELDEINILSKKPSDIYDGITMRVLRSINCREGAALVCNKEDREYIKDLNEKFPPIFNKKLNGSQCRYLSFLIRGELTVGETGRLFKAREQDLANDACGARCHLIIQATKQEWALNNKSGAITAIDPIYEEYCKSVKDKYTDERLAILGYLMSNQESLNAEIRRSNRKRPKDWPERTDKFIVRYPQTINDFCREAIYMRNCLLSYVDAFIHNDTNLLFMRKADDVNKPYITLEVYEGFLLQAYHRYNEDCTDDEAKWIREYCKRHGISTEKYCFNAEIDQLF